VTKYIKGYLPSYKRYGQIFLASAIFACLTLLTTSPLFLHFGDSIYGYPGDSFAAIWQFWRYENVLTNDWSWHEVEIIASPFGSSYGSGLRHPLHYAGLVMTLLSNEIFAFNWVIISSFWLSAFFAYVFARAMWQNEWAAILAGIVYGFCPYLSWRATQHIALAHMEWMPLYLLSLFYLRQKKNLISAILCGTALATVLVFNYYYGYFMIVATTVFLVCWGGYALKQIGISIDWKPAGLILVALLLAALLSLPWTLPIMRTVLGDTSSNSVIAQIAERPYNSLFHLSARPWDYLLPAIDHPVLGGYSMAIYDAIGNMDLGVDTYGIPNLQVNWLTQKGAYPHERPVYLSYTGLGLATFGLIRAYSSQKKKIYEREIFSILFFAILFMVSVWFSMPPVIPIGELLQNLWPSFPDWQIPTPSKFVYNILPMFRVYVRFGIVAILSVAVLAGFGLRDLLKTIKHKWKQVGVIAFVLAVVIFEYLHQPHNTVIPPVPAEYEWLAEQDADEIIAEYPRYYRYGLFYQRVHGKRMLNAYGTHPLVDTVIWPHIEDLSKQDTVERLGALGVRYILVHTADYFGPNPIDGAQWTGISNPLSQAVPGLNLIKTTPTAQIFEVTDTSARMMVWPSPIADATGAWISDTVWNWGAPVQRFYLINASDQTIQVSLTATSPPGEGSFRVINKDDGRNAIVPLQWENNQVLLQDFDCLPGETIIEVSFIPVEASDDIAWYDLIGNVDEDLNK